MSPSEFEFLINLIGENNLEKRTQRSGKPFLFKKGGTDALVDGSVHFFSQFFPCILLSNFVKMHWVFWVPYYFVSFIKFDKFYDTFLGPLHFSSYQNVQETAQRYRFTPLFKTVASGMKIRAEDRTVVTYHVARPDLLRP